MKIPLAYPKIPDSTNCMLAKCIAFEKYDGTNLHWVWKRNQGWMLFGTRRSQFELHKEGFVDFNGEHWGFEHIADLFEQTIEPLGKCLFEHKYTSTKEITVFTEYLGDNSFAGQHIIGEPKRLMVIDVRTDNEWLPMNDFIGDLGSHLPATNFPNIIYSGKYSGQLVEDIRNNKYNVKEGAVIKGYVDKQLKMVKVKTNQYMEKLKAKFKDGWKDHWE